MADDVWDYAKDFTATRETTDVLRVIVCSDAFYTTTRS